MPINAPNVFSDFSEPTTHLYRVGKRLSRVPNDWIKEYELALLCPEAGRWKIFLYNSHLNCVSYHVRSKSWEWATNVAWGHNIGVFIWNQSYLERTS